MKKLNRKGFTLIELLAVVVILAIILVITIPSVLSTMSSAREKQFQNAVNSAADWMTKQYELANLATGIDGSSSDTRFSLDLIADSEPTNATAVSGEDGNSALAAMLGAAGIGDVTNNIASGKLWRSNNRVCVQLTSTTTGSFGNTSLTKTSSGC